MLAEISAPLCVKCVTPTYFTTTFSGDCKYFAFAGGDERCPSNVGDTWLYHDGNVWTAAGGGLILSCYEEEEK